jgi:hypothetical protein
MRRDDWVDFFAVADHHLAIHQRLESWARWVRVRPHGWQVAPMFRQYRSHAWQWEAPTVQAAINIPEAVEMEKAVSLLPEKNREAIRWAYYWATIPPIVAKMNDKESGPTGMARRLAVTKEGLMDLIQGGRSMLINRGVL